MSIIREPYFGAPQDRSSASPALQMEPGCMPARVRSSVRDETTEARGVNTHAAYILRHSALRHPDPG
jgi:hypothetical protein